VKLGQQIGHDTVGLHRQLPWDETTTSRVLVAGELESRRKTTALTFGLLALDMRQRLPGHRARETSLRSMSTACGRGF
jgi:hypothetical protein